MVEAKPILHPRQSAVIAVLAKQLAIKEVTQYLQARGLNPMRMEARAVRVAADEYLAQHRDELIDRVAGMGRRIASAAGAL